MDNKQVGALLVGTAALVAALSVAAAQITQAIVLAGFYRGNMGGEVPLSPQDVSLHWLVLTAVLVLAASGLYFLFRPLKRNLDK